MNINELVFDKKNYNKGTEQGDKLLEKSITKFGFRQAAIVDKNGNIVAGNKRIAKAGELGIEDVNIVKGDPNKITAIQYDDFDLENDKKTKEYALADNQVAKINIELDSDIIVDDLGVEVANDWHIDNDNFNVDEPIEIKAKELMIKLTFKSKEELENCLVELSNVVDNYKCNVSVQGTDN